MPPTIVFINGKAVSVESALTVLEAVRAWNAEAARDVESGERLVTDSRGLPIAGDVPIHSGAIFRLVSNRAVGKSPE
ncbi:MAG: hypothetical protein ABR543_02670 [Gemmatimonadaceae bacterium]